MKILYLISSSIGAAGSIGGHYYSLLSTITALTSSIDTHIAVICKGECLALRSYKGPLTKIEYADKETCAREVAELITREKCDVIHSFDFFSHTVAKIVSSRLRIPLVITKPGGPTTRHSFPFSYDLVVFTKEDLVFFEKHPYFRKARIHLIPNRVLPQTVNEGRLPAIRKHIRKNSFTFIAISRFAPAKSTFFLRCIELNKRLLKTGVKTQCLIIGTIQDQAVYEDAAHAAQDSECMFLTDNEYTINASEFLPAADAVISMGRSAMEAASCGKPVLCCTNTLSIPYLLDAATVEEASRHNFTERATINIDEAHALEAVVNIIRSDAAYAEACAFTKKQFDNEWNVNNVSSLYLDIYASAKVTRNLPAERFLQILSHKLAR